MRRVPAEKTAHLSYISHEIQILGAQMGLDTAFKFLTAIFLYRKLSLTLCLIKKKLDFEDVKDTV